MSETLNGLGTEDRVFPPSAEFAAAANLTGEAYERAAADPEAFWGEQANRLSWAKPFTQVLDWSEPPHAKWFADGELERRLTVWTGTWKTGSATRSRSIGRVNPGIRRRSPTPTCNSRSRKRRTR